MTAGPIFVSQQKGAAGRAVVVIGQDIAFQGGRPGRNAGSVAKNATMKHQLNKHGPDKAAAGRLREEGPNNGGREMLETRSIMKSWSKARRIALFLLVPLLSLVAATAASAGNLTNTARAIGTAPTGAAGAVQSATSTVNVPVVAKNPAYTVVKSVTSMTTTNGASNTLTDGGDIITYSYTVVNTGNVTLDTVAITDPGVSFNGGAAQPLTSGPTLVASPATADSEIDVGETWTYTASYTLTQANVNAAAGVTNGVSNTVSVSVLDPQNVSISPTGAGSTLTARTTINSAPSLTIAKTSNLAGPLVAGDVVTFSYLVTNTGNVTITGVGIAETAFNGTGGTGALTPAGGASTLAPGAATTFTATYTVTQNDIDTLQP